MFAVFCIQKNMTYIFETTCPYVFGVALQDAGVNIFFKYFLIILYFFITLFCMKTRKSLVITYFSSAEILKL